MSARVTPPEMTPEEVEAYNKAYDEEMDRKDWGGEGDL